MKNLFASTIFFSSIIASSALAQTQEHKAKKFEGMYLFTVSKKRVSKCYKINDNTMAALDYYESCTRIKGGDAPFENSIGVCTRPDDASAHFFDSLDKCREAQSEVVENRKSKES